MLPRMLLVGLVFASSKAWVMETNMNRIVPGKTQDVQVECKYGNGSTGSGFQINKITRLRITKLDPFGNKETFAEIRETMKATLRNHYEYEIKVTGNIHKTEIASLKITWPEATEDTAGAYGCEINGYDSQDNFGTLDAKPKLIKEKVLTLDEVEKLIQAATEKCETKQRRLKSEILTLKTFIDTELKEVRQKVTENGDSFSSTIEELKANASSSFATKNELSSQVSELKTSVMSEIESETNANDAKLKDLQNMTENTNKVLQKQFVDLQSDYDIVQNRIKSVDSMHVKELQKLNSALQNVATETMSLDSKYQQVIDDLRIEISTNITQARCSCPTTETTDLISMPPPTQPVPQVWPDGYYGLVKSPAGCPPLRGLSESNPISAMANTFINLVVQTGSDKFEVKNCLQNDESEPSSFPTWPKGTYCILSNKGRCPADFQLGHIEFYILLHFVKVISPIQYCCRSDGPANSAIQLPSEKTFYLFRYQGTCQNVHGMTVAENQIQLAKPLTDDVAWWNRVMDPYPDVDEIPMNVTVSDRTDIKFVQSIRLCLYEH